MYFRIAVCALAGLAVSCTTIIREDEIVTAASFAEAQFGSVPPRRDLLLRGELKAGAEEILGYPYSDSRIPYWRDDGKTVWILKVRGKTHLITTGMVVADGEISDSAVLVYRENRGGAVRSKRFLGQFAGAKLRDDLTLNQRIDGITGATISVGAMKKAARLALYLSREVKE